MKKMKEQTYGWYPSVRDIYLSKNQPIPYHLECLYKFKESGYYNPVVDPPEPAFIIRGITPTPPPSRPSSSRPTSGRPTARPGTARAKSVPVPKFRPVPKMTSIPTPSQVWKKKTPDETAWGVVTPCSTPDVTSSEKEEEEKATGKPSVLWPSQQFVGKYDKPYVPVVPATAEEAFGTPIPPRAPEQGEDSGYVFIPTGDGGVEVHSPPVINWPDSYPRTPTPQLSVSSKASLGSADGITARRKAQEEYSQQVRKEKEEKRKVVERQRRFDNMLRQQQYQKKPQTPAATARSSQSLRRERIKSATVRRDKPSIPQRPVYSARPTRPASDTALYTSYQDQTTTATDAAVYGSYQDKKTVATDAEVYRAWEEVGGQEDGTLAFERQYHPVPPTPSLENLVIEEDRSPSPDYQSVVDKYGWRAEVHGDPYNIKKTTKRLPYTVKCEEPVLAPEPPKVHMESKETFFLNTIPRRHATFDVHQDWLSEGLHAKRIELQKRDGVNYRYKTFSFAY